ncbi:MAG: pyridoxal 5'-phosphate synthase glutaminase subunit PdxT [Thermoleophilia bacterium]|nr:pyridoxal 5'-phosphate synthase glutaminase subunit PdxT [Thermoleophilia bacterium]
MSSTRFPGRPVVGVLAVQGAFREHIASLSRVGASGREVRAARDLEGVDGLVIPGGESTTLRLVGGDSGLLDTVRRLREEGLPMLGTCAGMILLADRLADGSPSMIGGLDIEVRRNAYGRQQASFECDLDVPAIGGGRLRAIFIRAPWVESLGPGVEMLAEHDGRAVAVRQDSLLATSFHPELTDDPRVHALFLDTLRGNAMPQRRYEGGTGVGTQ